MSVHSDSFTRFNKITLTKLFTAGYMEQQSTTFFNFCVKEHFYQNEFTH